MISFSEYSKRVKKRHRFPALEYLPFVSPSDLFKVLTSQKSSVNSILLESSKTQAPTSRYSFILMNPYAIFSSKNNVSNWSIGGREFKQKGDPLDRLKFILNRNKSVDFPGAPPYVGGPAGYFSYELKDLIENRKSQSIDSFNLPDIHLCFFDEVIVVDHKQKCLKLVVSTTFHDRYAIKDAYRMTRDTLNEFTNRIKSAVESAPKKNSMQFELGSEMHITGKQKFIRMVKQVKRYIRIGDIFQANLSHCLRFSFKGNPFGIYLKQKKMNPTSFAAYADFGAYQIISASPERLIQSDGKHISTRPIAGTRPRSANAKKDRLLASELTLSEKECAEHVMLLDLERNDLGRVCEYGSVKVDEMMTVERYSHVQHIVSNVSGALRKNVHATDLIRAVFPGGTITGAPKVRAMQIIDQLEKRNRGIYTGSIGYISFCGKCDWNIVIRTMLIQGNDGYLQVGAGIVSDSDAEKEYDETIQKAVSFLKMLRR